MSDKHIPIIVLRPVRPEYPITSKFGEISKNPAVRKLRGDKPHDGIDFGTLPHLPIAECYACSDGKVIVSDFKDDGFGNRVSLWVEKERWTAIFIYAHLFNMAVKVGDKLVEGSLIGYMGKTGNATGAHLHFECRMPDGMPMPVDDFYWPESKTV